MANDKSSFAWQLVVAIVNEGVASRAIRIGRHAGAHGATVILGRGTLRRPLLRLLELDNIRKEIVLMVVENGEVAIRSLAELNQQLHLDKPNHGIAFSMDVSHLLGTGSYDYAHQHESEEIIMKNQAIFIIVDKGNAEQAMRVAEKAGAHGGTIINARGSGIHESGKIFQMAIEPEKEILLIVSETEKTAAIVEAVRDELNIEAPGQGIIFVQDVRDAVGLRKAT